MRSRCLPPVLCTGLVLVATSCRSPFTTRLPESGAGVALEPATFSLTTTGAPQPDSGTHVELRLDPVRSALVVDFEALSDPYVAQNQYTEDNSDMWNQEVFEMFIAPGTDTPIRYVELEVNPNGALYTSWIVNPNGLGTQNEHEFFDGHERGVETRIERGSDRWAGHISFPLAILGAPVSQYRYNLFRVTSLTSHADTQADPWTCTNSTCSYLAWSPTYSGSTPAFHIPAYFGRLVLTP